MKKIIRILFVIGVIFFVTQSCFATERILVLPDNVQFDTTNYYVYPDASTMFASDTINALKMNKRIEIVSMKEVRDALRSSINLNDLVKKTLKEFKYNYNVDFIDLKTISKRFNTPKVLLITSTTDTQNYFMKRSVWSIINVPGTSQLDPSFKLNTYAVLVDVDKEVVLWEKNYEKVIRSDESRMLAVSFAPAGEQLNKIKFYSSNFIAPTITLGVEAQLAPPLVYSRKVDTAMLNTTKKNSKIPQTKAIVKKTNTNVLPIQFSDIAPRPVLNTTPEFLKKDSMINDL